MAADVVVLLGSRWPDLREHGTRWRHVLVRWAQDDRVRSLTVVDFPRFGKRVSVVEQDSWLGGCRSFRLEVPGAVDGRGGQAWGWHVAAGVLRRRLPAPAPTARVAIAATPVSVPLLARLGAARTGFDGVDDWRAYPGATASQSRVVNGYRAAARCTSVSTVSDVLSQRLSADFGLTPVTIGNGVDVTARADSVLHDLPSEPFAVYVGSIQQRVDLDLLEAVAAQVPVVVAGPADDEHARLLRRLPLCWLGPLPLSTVPALLERASVGLLPHRLDELTTSMAPMKLLEYVAAGLPVVSTPLPGVERHPGVVVMSGSADFAAAVREALLAGRHEPPAQWLAEHDWARVAEKLLRLHVLGSR